MKNSSYIISESVRERERVRKRERDCERKTRCSCSLKIIKRKKEPMRESIIPA